MRDIGKRSLGGRAGVGALAVISVAGALAPWLAAEPTAVTGPALLPPAEAHPFGTDDLGRDVLALVLHGASNSLRVGFVSAGIAALIGLAVGGVAGLRGGAVDRVLTSATAFVQALPRFFLALAVVSLFGADDWTIIAVLGFTAWPDTSRMFRAQVQGILTRDFIMAARAAGRRDAGILVRHVGPLAAAPLAAQISHQAAGSILAEAGLAFVGLGDPHVISWGALLASSQYFVRDAWWMSVFPGLAVTATVLACNLVADAFVQRAPLRA